MKSSQILKEISQLISSVENSEIPKTDKLKLVKVLLSIKLKLIELMAGDLKKEAKIPGQAIAAGEDDSDKLSKKHDLIVRFIKQNSGRVGAAKLLELGIASRTLRRYIKELSDSGRVSVEKKGRRYFYAIVT